MELTRRSISVGALAFASVGGCTHDVGETPSMYGLIGKMSAAPSKRDEMIAILLEGAGEMPGCLSYIIASDPADPDGIWITEVWDSAASHQASLQLPSVQAAIQRARPIIAGFGPRYETVPIGGHGLRA